MVLSMAAPQAAATQPLQAAPVRDYMLDLVDREEVQSGMTGVWLSIPLALVGSGLVYQGLKMGVETVFQSRRYQQLELPVWNDAHAQLRPTGRGAPGGCCGHYFSGRARMAASAATASVLGAGCLFASYISWMHGWEGLADVADQVGSSLWNRVPSLKVIGDEIGVGFMEAVCKRIPQFCTG